MLTKNSLSHFSGSERFFSHWTNRLVYTEGVRYVAENGGAHWLIDAIASHQHECKKKELLKDFQVWRLYRDKLINRKAHLECLDGNSDKTLIHQEIPYTDFPLDEIKFYVEKGSVDGLNITMVMMLPSERYHE